jgi:hypothetical protein
MFDLPVYRASFCAGTGVYGNFGRARQLYLIARNPTLVDVCLGCDRGQQGQILVISHHPEFINQWAPTWGVQFVREGVGPVHVEMFHGDSDSALSPAELIARGWERE